ncbi:MAG TPA: phosphate regulon sensor histidine kinase PhoR [Steroidobacteraceae bacterium]|nr:phosphate regulon sensor histidine kinase PhoR [Steroidobacteraceae bacterium]
MSPAWSFALARLIGLVAIAVVVGYFLGQISLTVSAVLAGYLALTYVRLYRLERWLRKRRTEEPPDFHGVWGDVVALVMRIYRRKQFHKRRIVQLFREFRRMTTAMPDGVVVMSADREIQWFNRNAARLLKLRRKVDYGQRIDNLVRHPDFIRYLAVGDFSQPVVIRSTVDASAHLALHVVAYGAGQQLLLVRDVTHQIRLEAMRKDFVANASHELRSPLTVITGYVDALADDPGMDPAWHGPLEEMRRQAERMRAVVNALIELSRLESSSGEAGTDLVDVGGMLTLMRREVLALDRHPEVALALESDAKLLGSEQEIHSIFSNLISNAVKYTPPEGRIDIRWWADVAGGHFSVRDTGVGIAREHLPRITERFYRVDPGRARTTGGSGLGLAIAKHALQRHGGTLEIESEEGIGSRFTCHFPQRRIAARAPLAANQ